MKRKVLIAIDQFAKNSTKCLEMLKSRDFDVIWNESNRPLDCDNDFNMYKDIDYVIAGLERYDSAFFKKAKKLKAISRVGVGIDSIDTEAARAFSKKIFITTDKPSVAVAELCVSNMIALLRGTFMMNTDLKNGNWNIIQGRDIRNCTVGIIGLGSIGKQVVKRLIPFGPKIIGYARTWDHVFSRKFLVDRCTSLEEIINSSDIITIHLPLEESTKNLIDLSLIKRLKKDAVVLNTSRAGVIDNDALANSLRKKQILGAAIDVFDEDRTISPYDQLENVIVTPHVGSHTSGTRIAMEESAVSNILIYDSILNPKKDENIISLLASLEKNSIS